MISQNSNYQTNINEPQLAKSKNSNKAKQFFIDFYKKNIAISLYQITLMGILLGIYLVVRVVAKFTILRIVPLEIPFIFYIMYGVILGGFRGLFLAIISDTFGLLVTGSIGTWYYLYAMVPPAIAIVSWLYYLAINKNKIFGTILTYVFFILCVLIIYYVFTSHNDPNSKQIQLNASKKNPVYVANGLFIGILSSYSLVSLSILITFTILYFKHQSKRWYNYILMFGLVSLIMMIFRWSLDPLLYIRYYNYINSAAILDKSIALKSVGTDYAVVAIPIIIKSLFTIPIYITISTPITVAIEELNHRYQKLNSNPLYTW
ncbi:hypothetical protein [Mycoplasmopsis opalescens]|uniref:hypothetical protein n=1 Tax=Mycoplasmopsis opalescens TaxID=114886 RepID=UPI0012EB0A3B|nr:hypothetical protein [Mycoplasmopsis opalescens]